jgi:hypothetical protein
LLQHLKSLINVLTINKKEKQTMTMYWIITALLTLVFPPLGFILVPLGIFISFFNKTSRRGDEILFGKRKRKK